MYGIHDVAIEIQYSLTETINKLRLS